MSWAGKILRVDLTAGTCMPETLNKQWARDYLGQRGLATKYFVEEVDAKVDPLSPANKIIWATGPLTGTMASTGGRYSVITKGALTGAIACSNSGGYWGAELKFAGWDMIIFEGKSPKPVYLCIEDDKAQLLDAGFIWGKSVWDSEPAIKARHQDPLMRVSCIGRAGETGCLFASVMNDLHRAAGRSGVGTVMGSKNLKAIAVRGTRGVGNVRDPKAFMAATFAAKKVLADNPVTGQGLPKYGTQVLMNVINEIGANPYLQFGAAPTNLTPIATLNGSPITTLEPGRSSARNASRFFSTATRPTVMKIGLGKSSTAGSSGLNRSVSTPRVQVPSFLNPLALSSCLSEAVATIVMAPAAWKCRSTA